MLDNSHHWSNNQKEALTLMNRNAKVGEAVEKTYSTSQIAKLIGIHPNTVRLYEELELIQTPFRKANGYRVFTSAHVDQFRLARIAFHIEVLQSGLRKRMTEVVKLSARGQYDQAMAITKAYRDVVESEIKNAYEAIKITKGLLKRSTRSTTRYLRKEVSDALGLSMDTLRNWEMNGLLRVKRKENGYRVYDEDDMKTLKIIRSLRCANYSLSSILRMMNVLLHDARADAEQALSTPDENEEIVSVCDRLIVSLKTAYENAERVADLLMEMKRKYSNPPL